ncbi:MAG: EamA family transporter [Nanoarchaeota archaeon]
MESKYIAILLVILSTLFASFGQLFYKLGVDKLEFNLSMLTNYTLILGILLYIIAGVILIIALKYGELSAVYPIYATNYIWVSLLSLYILKEMMNYFKWLGVLFIVIGVGLLGVSKR